MCIRDSRTGEEDELPLVHHQAHVVHCRPGARIRLRDAGEADDRLAAAVSRSSSSSSITCQLEPAVTVSTTAFSSPMRIGPIRMPARPKVYTPVTRATNIQ